MTDLEPYSYPQFPHDREHAPAGYADHTGYKPWLRDEFEFRCAYCLQRETWSRDGQALFSADHVIPQSLDPEGRILNRYSNLIYACTACNAAKREMIVLDPTDEALGWHLRVNEDGTVDGISSEGRYLTQTLWLNLPGHVRERLRVFRIIDLFARYPTDADIRAEYRHLFGYPDDLPDLARLQPPGGNRRPDGVRGCHFERRVRGELPEVY